LRGAAGLDVDPIARWEGGVSIYLEPAQCWVGALSIALHEDTKLGAGHEQTLPGRQRDGHQRGRLFTVYCWLRQEDERM
jgi:hypothetical protein